MSLERKKKKGNYRLIIDFPSDKENNKKRAQKKRKEPEERKNKKVGIGIYFCKYSRWKSRILIYKNSVLYRRELITFTFLSNKNIIIKISTTMILISYLPFSLQHTLYI